MSIPKLVGLTEKFPSIQFSTGWQGYKITLETINKWNTENRFCKAFLDSESDPMLEMDIALKEPVSHASLERWFSLWASILDEFKDTVLKK